MEHDVLNLAIIITSQILMSEANIDLESFD